MYFYVFMFSLYSTTIDILAYYIEIHIDIVIKKWVTNSKVKPTGFYSLSEFYLQRSEICRIGTVLVRKTNVDKASI